MYFVYIVQCSDGYYYTGVTNDLEKRVNEHNSGSINGFTSRRLPVKLVYSQCFQYIDEAIRAEKKIKGWSRKKKEALIRGDFNNLIALSKSKSKQRVPFDGLRVTEVRNNDPLLSQIDRITDDLTKERKNHDTDN